MLKSYYNSESQIEIGIDEAGRGPLWGPLMAAAVWWPSENDWNESHREIAPKIKDSKKISAKKRELIAESIKKISNGYGIGIVSPEEIDTFGATYANQLAFRRALTNLYEKNKVVKSRNILIDGVLSLQDLKENESQVTIINGDSEYISIAAASILAKVEHDKWVLDWCKKNEEDAIKYDLLNCKGYGTAKHRDAIKKYGYTDLHRRLYLRKLIPNIIVSRYKIIDDN